MSARIAVIGAGPVGLEAALYAAALGHQVDVYERGPVGAAVRRWGHVRLFSPFAMNHSPLAAAALARAGVPVPAGDAYLTGAGYVDAFLAPLARTAELDGRVHAHTRVVAIGREGLGKQHLIGGPRERHRFRLLLEGQAGERIAQADLVLDCAGSYGNHNWLGDGNIPAPGERAAADRIDYLLVDLAGDAAGRYRGRRVLLVGAGQSAATSLDGLLALEGTRVIWVARTDRRPPLPEVAGDSLPERARLARQANFLASGADPRVAYRGATAVAALALEGDAVAVTLRGPHGTERVTADRILAHVGYRPDPELHRELQIHQCYATDGPMKLAASLLASAGGDCLAQTPAGPEVLRNPEPGYYVLGAKSYGRNSAFLIRLGLEQVRDVFTLISGRPDLDLHRP